jgi:hypothetical protein
MYSESQRILLQNAFTVVEKVPSTNREEPTFKNMWNFNLPDAAFGWVLLDIKEGRVSAEIKAQGIPIDHFVINVIKYLIKFCSDKYYKSQSIEDKNFFNRFICKLHLGFNFAYRRAPAINPITGAPQGTLIGAPTSPSPMDRQSRRNPSQWQPSPALVPQQSHIGTAPSPILAPQSSSPTQTTSPNEINNWKQPWNNESSSPSEGSTSQKIITNIDNSKHVAGSDVSSSSQTDTIATTNSNNDTANTTFSENININQVNGNGESGSNWAEQTQQETWKQSDLNESNQAQTNSSLNSEEGPSSTNTTVPQTRSQYSNNRRVNKFTAFIGNITTPISEDEIKEFFTRSSSTSQVISLIFN